MRQIQALPFLDIFKNHDFAGQVHFGAQKGKWGFFIDPSYLKITQDGTRRDVKDVKLNVEQWLIEFGGIYQLGQWAIEGKGKRSITVDALGGGSFWYLKPTWIQAAS
jgi:hypothetical protein